MGARIPHLRPRMISHRIRYTPVAAESLRPLPPQVKPAVRAAIRELASNPFLGRPLALELAGFWSLRVARYRLIYRIRERALEIHLMGPRSDIYEVFRRFLERAGTP